jgi:DNA polymerase-4
MNKPDGLFEITPENRDKVLFSAKLTDICGLGFRLEKRLLGMGIKDFKTLREIPMEFLQASFGPFWSVHLKRLSYGEDDSNLTGLEELQDTKSISRTFTLFENTSDRQKIKQTLRNLCEEVGYKLRKMDTETRQIGIMVRGDEQGGHSHKTLKYYTDDSGEIFHFVWDEFNQLNWQNNVRFLGVWAGLLSRKANLSLSIFPEVGRKEKLWQAVDKINDKFGGFTLYPAVLLGGELIRPEVNGYLGDKKYQFGV